MSAFLTVAGVYLLPSALVVLWIAADRWLDRREAEKRAEQDREVSAEWLALLAATETSPIYDALVCESIEKAEGWVA